MANYDKETKFYWLQLKEDFFDEDIIDWLLEQENGEKYAIFYLKLCLKSLKTNGILIRNVGKILIPYDNNKLAELTKTSVDTVIVAMEIFKNLGLIQILENGELYLTQLENLIGSKSKGALKKQQQLQRRKQKTIGVETGVENLPPKIEIELELKQDIDIEIEPEINDVPKDLSVPYEKIKDLFHSICTSYPKVIKLSDNRKKTIAARYKEHNCDIEKFKALFMKAEASDFLKGINKKNWKADFDWLLNQTNMIKVLEDKYKNKEDNNGGSSKQSNRENGSEYEQFCG